METLFIALIVINIIVIKRALKVKPVTDDYFGDGGTGMI